MTYKAAKRKLWLERLAMFPFVFAGRVAGWMFPLKSRHGVVLFFPSSDIGGSPQVNIDLLHCIKDKNPLVIFSKKPRNAGFREKYKIKGVRVIDLHRYIDNKKFHFINFFFRGVLASWINGQKPAAVFGGETIFFYKVIPHLRRSIHRVELCHLDTWLPYSIGFADEIDLRVFSTEKLKQKVEEQYRENQMPAAYFDKLFFTDNAIDIPVEPGPFNEELQVYFIGRGSPQKRVHLATGIAAKAHNEELNAKFNFVGAVESQVDSSNFPYCRFFGNVGDQQRMKQIYREADVLLMTSAFEGLPIVVMEMMAHGKPIISTAVNAIPDYVHHGENGLLIFSRDEQEIMEEGLEHIRTLVNDRLLLKRLGKAGREIAIKKFSRENFCNVYRKLLRIDEG